MSRADIHVVLVNPEIPQNTGSTARLCAATNCKLHLIEPLGFSLEDKYLKRAGLDYWPEVKLEVHKSWQEFLNKEEVKREELFFFSTKASKKYHKASYPERSYLVFGCETKGLPNYLQEEYADERLLIPMENKNVRSINLASSVAVALFEVRRQKDLL